MSRCAYRNRSGWVSRFWFAVQYNEQKSLRQMISQGVVNINHIFKQPGHRYHSQTALFMAVSKNNRDLASLLIGAGCDLEKCDQWGETALFVAVRQGKINMLRHLVASGVNINHLNNKGETVLLTAISWGRKEIVKYLVTVGVNVDHISSEGTTALLLAFEIFEKMCSVRHATRKTAPESIVDILCLLVPLSSTLNHHHPNRGTALGIALSLEARHFHTHLKLSKLLLQHGAVPDRLFFLRFGGLSASTSKLGSEFFTQEFFDLAILASANLQREKTWLLTVLTEMPQELQPYQPLFQYLLERASQPLSLHILCLINIRKTLDGKLWAKIDKLLLPVKIKHYLMLKL